MWTESSLYLYEHCWVYGMEWGLQSCFPSAVCSALFWNQRVTTWGSFRPLAPISDLSSLWVILITFRACIHSWDTDSFDTLALGIRSRITTLDSGWEMADWVSACPVLGPFLENSAFVYGIPPKECRYGQRAESRAILFTKTHYRATIEGRQLHWGPWEKLETGFCAGFAFAQLWVGTMNIPSPSLNGPFYWDQLSCGCLIFFAKTGQQLGHLWITVESELAT